ncbi:MAG: hypothetical protein IJD92_00375 [Bacilli bacterium]|nr:hypothetical protein [Bacilli bacterium]
MNTDSIKNIFINLLNNKTIIADEKMFTNLYISNIDSNGDEIPYENIDNTLVSNFFMIKLKNKIIEYNLTNKQLEENAFTLLNNEKNIESIIINFKNGNSLPFILNSNNTFHTFKSKNDLCIIQSEYDIKYYENLFN